MSALNYQIKINFQIQVLLRQNFQYSFAALESYNDFLKLVKFAK